ncbi:DUF418 domain-containing protein [Aurantiacibacter marinus]|uniref:DUF418 domain-containing protein n=1 Tax=Aurantiacibacter marinus TaxID=874156 RepID=A0A0H0XTH6_9SPHN|nr:DUF418 domain-containing protein [Aurantiacibacter marinus]KLI63600.1 hypothetical protein AAV99_07540 [Aurantiacibacter marinus]
MNNSLVGAAPVTSAERIGVLDALRGFALLGVLLANLTEFAVAPWMATDAQIAALSSAPADTRTHFILSWLVYGKANTLFATLFGIGFWVQMERLQKRDVAFETIYLRRLFILLAIGLVHMSFVWIWDILHVYALAGFLLFFMRGLSQRAFIIIGISLAVFGSPVLTHLIQISGFFADASTGFDDAAILSRQAASAAGNYTAIFAGFMRINWYEWVAGGMLYTWVLYALGRFLIGAYIARRGWVQRAAELLPQYAKVMAVALPLGLAGQYINAAVSMDQMQPLFGSAELVDLVDYVSRPLTALGYACLIVLFFHSGLRPVAAIFAPVGRMALTNYIAQSFFIAFLLFGVGPGLALSGREGTFAFTIYALIFFAAQTVFSHFWLKVYAFGPLEYLWRWATYGDKPRLRRQLA